MKFTNLYVLVFISTPLFSMDLSDSQKQLSSPLKSHPIIQQLKEKLSQASVDTTYLESPQGRQHLQVINDELEHKNVHISFNQQNNQAHLSINLRLSTAEDRVELIPILSFTRSINNSGNAPYKVTRNELIKLKKCAAELGQNPIVVNPLVKKYLNNQTLTEKLAMLWHGEVIPGAQEIVADHIGKKIGYFILILLGYNQTNQEDEKQQEIAPELAHHLTLLHSLENLKEKRSELVQMHGDDTSSKIYHNEEYIKLKEKLIATIKATKE